jgi:anti-anti-sigma factor
VPSRHPLSGGAVAPLAIEVARRRSVVVVTVSGEIDAHTSPQLRSCLLDQVAQGSGRTVLIDLTAVTFCDSTALGVLVGTHRRLQGEGRRLEICAASPSVRHLFEVSGLDHVLHFG